MVFFTSNVFHVWQALLLFLFLLSFVNYEVWFSCEDWRRTVAGFGMEYYLNENFGFVKQKKSEEALERWRILSGFVKNRKRRFRFTANLAKRSEAEAIRRANLVSFLYLFNFPLGCQFILSAWKAHWTWNS